VRIAGVSVAVLLIGGAMAWSPAAGAADGRDAGAMARETVGADATAAQPSEGAVVVVGPGEPGKRGHVVVIGGPSQSVTVVAPAGYSATAIGGDGQPGASGQPGAGR
jgi:hypothetical protein